MGALTLLSSPLTGAGGPHVPEWVGRLIEATQEDWRRIKGHPRRDMPVLVFVYTLSKYTVKN